VIVDKVLLNQVSQVLLAEHHEVIEAFSLHALDPSLGKGIQVRTQWRDLAEFDALRLQD